MNPVNNFQDDSQMPRPQMFSGTFLATLAIIVCFFGAIALFFFTKVEAPSHGDIVISGSKSDDVPVPQVQTPAMSDMTQDTASLITKDGRKFEAKIVEVRDVVQDDHTVPEFVNRITLSNETGQNPKVIYEGVFIGRSLIPMKLSDDESKLFFATQPDGLGGYILYRIIDDIYRLDIKTGKAQKLTMANTPETSGVTRSYYDVTQDGSRIAYTEFKINPAFSSQPQAGDVVVFNLNKKTEIVRIPIDLKSGFTQAGNITFSPDGKRIAYLSHFNNPDNEEVTIIAHNLQTGKTTELFNSSKKRDPNIVETFTWEDASHLKIKTVDGTPLVFEI